MRSFQLHLLAILLIFSNSLVAETASQGRKPFNVGIGSYATVISYDESFAQDDELSGLAFSAAYVVTDIVAIRAIYFSQEHDDLSALDSRGLDLLAHVGFNLAAHGFKAYIGGGYFRDTWELGSVERTFDGLQLSGGIGYNWDIVALDFILGIRDASDYEDFVNDSGTFPRSVTATAATGSLLLSLRF